MIDFATPDNFSEAVRIWTICFGDTEQYTRFLFDRLLTPKDILFHLDEVGRPDAMLCLKPFRLQTVGDEAEGAYIFGVATLPESRSRGISTALLAETHRRLSDQGVALATLVPGGPGLFNFYARLDYETAFSVRRLACPASEIPKETPPCALEPARLDSLHEFRRDYYAGRHLFVDWNDAWLRYVDTEARTLGGGTWTFGDESGYAVCYPYKNMVIVKELAVAEDRFDHVLAAIHEKFHAVEYRIHLPEDFKTRFPSQVGPFAMVHWLDDGVRKKFETKTGDPSYTAHVLDGPTLGAVLQIV